jgi:hypothetical protein
LEFYLIFDDRKSKLSPFFAVFETIWQHYDRFYAHECGMHCIVSLQTLRKMTYILACADWSIDVWL